MGKIYRSFNIEDGELRALMQDDLMVIEGYCAKYNTPSHILRDRGGRPYRELLEPGLFKDHLKDDVAYTYNHNPNTVMAHTRNGTLTLSEDEIGLKFRAVLNNTSDSRDLYERVQRGEAIENSFGYHEDTEKQKLDRVAGSDPILRISGIIDLFDVATLSVKAAYPSTEVEVVRSLDDYETEELEDNNKNSDYYIRELELLKLKNNIK